MGVFLLFVFLLAKFNFGEYILLIYWFYICGKNIHGYFNDGRMFAFGGLMFQRVKIMMKQEYFFSI